MLKSLLIIFLSLVYSLNSYGQNIEPGFLVQVEFRLDMKGTAKGLPVGIRGNTSPLSWEKTLQLTDPDGDGCYEGRVGFATNENPQLIEYKFVIGQDQPTWELEGLNRILLLQNEDTVLRGLVWDYLEPLDISSLPKLQPKQLLEDFKIAKDALLFIHPGLYRYNSRNQIINIFSHYEKLFNHPMDFRQAYLLYSEMLAKIKCGHTYANFFNQSGFIQEVVLNQPDKLPFTFRIIEGRMIVVMNVSGYQELDKSPEILSINNVKVSEILDRVKELIKADGNNDAKRLADLNLFGLGRYESFDSYFPLIYPPVDGAYNLKIKDLENNFETEVSVSTITRSERAQRIISEDSEYPINFDDLWELEFWDNETAYLQLGTFDVFQLSFEWQDFLSEVFSDIRKRKIKNLILDIRWNEGGQDEILLYLGKMLTTQPVQSIERTELIRYKKIPENLKPYLFTWDNNAYDYSDQVTRFDDSYFYFNSSEPLIIKPSSKGFRGNVFLLINSANSSATFYFTELVKKYNIATIIGTPTGGNQRGLNGGQMFFVRLPNSQIEFDIPIIGTFSEELPDMGIEPDILVNEDIESIRTKKDPILNMVKTIISGN